MTPEQAKKVLAVLEVLEVEQLWYSDSWKRKAVCAFCGDAFDAHKPCEYDEVIEILQTECAKGAAIILDEHTTSEDQYRAGKGS